MPVISLGGVVAVGTFFSVLAASVAVRAALATPLRAAPATGSPSAVLPPTQTPRVVTAIGQLASSDDPRERESLEVALLQAGFSTRTSLATLLALRAASTVALPVAAWLVLRPVGLAPALLVATMAAGLGYYAPVWILQLLRRTRQRRIRRSVPNMLDMLVSCVEAGLGIDVALRHVARDIGVASPELAEELDLINAELTAGLPRGEALALLERRTGVDELAALVNVLGVVERFGAGIAQSLRAHAYLSRRRRALDAETRAARAAPMLTVVMVLFILPVLFVVLIGPTIINVSRTFNPTGTRPTFSQTESELRR